jgi:HSP20 family protein
MAESFTKVPVKAGGTSTAPTQFGNPFESLRHELDRLFEDFTGGFWRSTSSRSFFDIAPFGRGEQNWAMTPNVDVTETDKSYEIAVNCRG